jgi:hypothetical protein
LYRIAAEKNNASINNVVDVVNEDSLYIRGSMWNERKMPERWYDLLGARMQVERQRMDLIKHCNTEDDRHEELLTRAHNLDREMLSHMAIEPVWTASPLSE